MTPEQVVDRFKALTPACVVTQGDDGMKPLEYSDRPNLRRVVCELAKFKEPYKTADLLLTIAGPMLKEETDHDEQ